VIDGVDLIEVVLRLTSALMLTVAAFCIAAGLIHRRLYPLPTWAYIGAVVTVVAAWRWFVVALLRAELFPDVAATVVPWIQPINQALYALIGFSILVLAWSNARLRRR
jgi:hypothetical protein